MRDVLELKIMFVVCGEALFDVFATGTTPTGLGLDARIGGSPFNVAVGLKRLEQRVAFMGGVSRGFLGERLLQAFRDEGVEETCVHRLDAPTTLSLVGVDGHGVPSYSFYGAGCADRLLPLTALDTLPADTQAIHFGSYAMVVAPTADAQRALVAREHTHRVIAYDPNVRLNVEPNLQVWRDTLDWMSHRTHLLKVSDEDLGLLYPGTPHAELAARWRSAGVAMVVITRGGDGATGYAAEGEVPVAPVQVEVIDTVGAGDTFQAAMLTALAERGVLSVAALPHISAEVWRTVLSFAAQAAAITCSRRGADLPRRHELA
ncbi:fructokinase [Vitreoscilla filiformis]|uniref:Fructokinase n=2 Tax=Vitreoscilla filiformis TaxID=63 RepID=A0A221KDK0_VITFI|nr:fructokinase [Vitreoscilla filiformis]